VRQELFIQNAIFPALRLLPEKMDSQAARAMMIAMALQESRIEYRVQIGGPAHSYWQMELGGGVRGVLNHPASKPHIQAVLEDLDYDPESAPDACYVAIQHNDILAAAFARLLLWTLPDKLPAATDVEGSYRQYIAAWGPGKPHPATWPRFYSQAWGMV